VSLEIDMAEPRISHTQALTIASLPPLTRDLRRSFARDLPDCSWLHCGSLGRSASKLAAYKKRQCASPADFF
jgi:hypothetical protein